MSPGSPVRMYKPDALVVAVNKSCKHFWPLNKLLTDKVKDQTGIPTLRFEVDMFDKRFTPGSEMRRIMTEFLGAQGES